MTIDDMLHEDVRINPPSEKNGIRAAVSWSGGKDSTATAILALNDGYEVFIGHSFVEFAPGIPFVTKRMEEFIYSTADVLKGYGVDVTIIKPVSYVELCRRVYKESPLQERNGKMRGYPCPMICEFQQYLKEYPMSRWKRSVHADVEFLGICFDETNRHGQLHGTKRSLLNERGYTQEGARQICEVNGLLSPVYTDADRDGCGLCFNAKPDKIKEWLNDRPEAIPILRELDAELKEKAIFGNRWGRNGVTLHDIGVI